MKLQLHISKSAKEAENYFVRERGLESYYSQDGQEMVGNWGGKGAELLGLKGKVTDEAFVRLLNNRHPVTGKQLTDRMRSDRRAGFDFTFSVPKPVSLVWAYTRDKRIVDEALKVITEVMRDAELHSAVRVRKGSKNRDENRITDNLVYAVNIHFTARPVEGIADPQLHFHIYVMNVSWDAEEKKWKALQPGKIWGLANRLEAVATRLFEEKLSALGMVPTPAEYGFGLQGISRGLVEKFSRRTEVIEAEAKRRGTTDPSEKAKLGALTREKKIKGVPLADLEPEWWGRLLPEEKEALEGYKTRLARSLTADMSQTLAGVLAKGATQVTGEAIPGRERLGRKGLEWVEERVRSWEGQPRPGNITAVPTDWDRRAAALAVAHVFERNSVVVEYELVGEACDHWCLGRTTVAGIRQALAEMPLCRTVKDGLMFVTTAEVLREERRIIDWCQRGKGLYQPVNLSWRIENEELNEGQRAAVFHALQSTDFITAIAGDPGVGKTTVLREIKRGMEARFQKMMVLAPGAATANEVLRKEGFAEAETVARLLNNEQLQKQAQEALWVVDEAGQLSTRDTDQLIALAVKLNARLLLVGDTGQHHAVQRGQAFELLENQAGMQTVRITDILRQQGDYKRLVELVLAGETEAAFALMDKMGVMKEMPLAERKIALAQNYVAALENGETALVVAPTHAERRDVTSGIREALKQKGMLKEEKEIKFMQNLSWTDGQKSEPANYRVGMLVEINEPVKGFRIGERLEVIGIRDDMVKVRSLHPHKTKTMPLPLDTPESFSVHERALETSYQRDILRNLSWTDAQRSDPEHYEPGLVVQINGHVDGFALGEKLEVVMVREDMVKARSLGPGGKFKPLPLSLPDTFAVYERDDIEICKGERISITGNSRAIDGRRITNKSSYIVDYINNKGEIVLENGMALDRKFQHLDHGYAVTSHAAQGMTVDRVFLAQSAALSYGAIDARQFLVSITRGRKGMMFYPDNIEVLKDIVSIERERPMATEIFQQEKSSAMLGELSEQMAAKAIEQQVERERAPELEHELEIGM